MTDVSNANTERTPLKLLRQVVSLGALILALAHLVWPSLAIDAITLALMVIAILPWLAPLVKSLKIPGGWKVEFQELQKAASRAESAGLLAAEPSPSEKAFSFQSIAKRDANLALAGLRIEIEKRLSQLAEAHGLRGDRPLGIGQLLRILTQSEVLTTEERSVLADMVNMLNAAVHGASVDSRSADWAIDIGPRLLTSLDERVAEATLTSEDITLLKEITSSHEGFHMTHSDESIKRLDNANLISLHSSSEGAFVRATSKGKRYAIEGIPLTCRSTRTAQKRAAP